MTHRKILSEKEFFSKFYADCPSDIYTSVSEDDSSSGYSTDSGDMNIRPIRRQKFLMIDSDT